MIPRELSENHKKIPHSTPVYLDERHRNPVSELIYIEFEKNSTELHNLSPKSLHIFEFLWSPQPTTMYRYCTRLYRLYRCIDNNNNV
jgi:hypothetical protein